MKEDYRDYHPPFSFPWRPDLGGTSYDFSREVSADKVIFSVVQGDRLTKIRVPSKEQFVAVTVEEDKSGVFLEAFYEYTGPLSFARLWLKSVCSQEALGEKELTESGLANVLGRLDRSGTDIVLEADLDADSLRVYHCEEASRGGVLKPIDVSIYELPRNARAFVLYNKYTKVRSATPVKFVAGVADNTLSLGFCPNERQVINYIVSTNTDMDRLFDGTPRAIKDFLETVFLQKD